MLKAPGGARSRWGFTAALTALVAVSLLAEFTRLAGSDTGFLLDAARRVLDGARLYLDVVEINPPLVILLNLPAVLIGRWLGISDILVYRVGFALVLLAALGLSARRLRETEAGASPALRRWLLLVLAFVLFPLSREDFGEREHLALALLVPYLLLVTARAEGRPVRRIEAAALGALAGIAFALKPHFLLVWVGAEIYLRVVRGRWGAAPESAAIVSVLAAYGVAVLALVPAYLEIVRLLSRSYLRFLYDPIFHLLPTAPGAAVTFLSLLAYTALRQRARHPRLWQVLALGVASCFAAGLLQQKGLRYHFLPAFGLGFLLLGLVVADSRRPLGSWVHRTYHVVAAGALAAAAVVTCVRSLAEGLGLAERPGEAELRRMVALVRRHAAGESVLVLSYHIGSSYPLVNYGGVRSASRFPQLWILPAEYLDQLHAPGPLRFHEGDAVSPAERYLRASVLADAEAARPKLIIVLRHARDIPENGLRRLDYLGYFGRDPRFARILERYQLLAELADYTVYERIPDGAVRTAPAPGSAPGVADVVREDRAGLHLRLAAPDFLLGAVVFLLAAALLARRERRRAG